MKLYEKFKTGAKELLKRFQTENEAGVGHLKREFSNHPSSGLTPAKLGNILLNAERSSLVEQCELAEDIEEKDAHIFSELQKRRRALLSIEWTVEPPRDATAAEEEDATRIETLLRDADWLPDLIFDMSDGLLKGFSNNEMRWEYHDGVHFPCEVSFRESSWFMVNPDNRNELRLRNSTANGLELQPYGWIQHRHRAKSGYVARTGLVRVLAWPFIFKNYSVRDLAEFLEIYGLPMRLGKYASGATEQEKATLMRAVMSMGHNAGGIIPKSMEMDFVEAAKGTADPYRLMMEWAEKSMSKAILGGTLTSQADGQSSTNALGNVHNEVRQELRDSDIKQIAATLNRDLILPLYTLNGRSYQSPRRAPKIRFDTSEPEDLKLYSEAVPSLVNMGMRISRSWAHERLKIPEADENEDVLMPSTSPAASSDQVELRMAALRAEDNDELIDRLARSASPEHVQGQADTLLISVINRINQGADLAALKSDLEKLLPQMNTDQLQDEFARLCFVAETWGRLNARD